MDILYSRDTDGNVPVHILGNNKYEIHRLEKKIICASARQVLINLTGHPQGRNWTFDRYFRQGSFASADSLLKPIIPILELFGPGGVVTDSGHILTGIKKTPQDITIHPESLRPKGKLQTPWTKQTAEEYIRVHGVPKVGINLDERGHEVAKLLFAGFKNWIFGSGYDPADVLQEVYKGILIRNLGTCPFDVRKASFGHYVHRVCQCILSNYHRKESRRYKAEMVGMKTFKDGAWKDTDVAEAAAEKPTKDPRLQTTLTDDMTLVLSTRSTKENRLALRIVPLLGQGYTHVDISKMLDISRTAVSKAMVTIRETARQCGYYPPSEMECISD